MRGAETDRHLRQMRSKADKAAASLAKASVSLALQSAADLPRGFSPHRRNP